MLGIELIGEQVSSLEREGHPEGKLSTDVNTNLETEVPNGKGFGYPPKVFTDPRYAATHLSPLDNEQGNTEEDRVDFKGTIVKDALKSITGVGVLVQIGMMTQ